jgi:hypothetical protein
VIANSPEEFEECLHDLRVWCEGTDAPISLHGSITVDNQHVCLMAGRFAPAPVFEEILSIHTTYPVGQKVYDYSFDLRWHLLDLGKLVSYQDTHRDGNTHVITVPRNSHDWLYGFRGSDDDAIHEMLRHGGTHIKKTTYDQNSIHSRQQRFYADVSRSGAQG